MTTKRRSFLPAFLKALPALAKTFPAHPAHFLPPHPGYFNWGKWFPDAIYKVLVQTRGRARAKWKSGQNPGRGVRLRLCCSWEERSSPFKWLVHWLVCGTKCLPV